MSKIKIQKGLKNSILRTKSEEVIFNNKKDIKSIKKLVSDMKETMIANNGLGLASPQIGKNLRIIVCLLNNGSKNEIILEMINPVITHFSNEKQYEEEGCLSLPDQFGKVERNKEIIVQFVDIKGENKTLKLKDFNAVIVQHEIDHLDGVLFLDKVII